MSNVISLSATRIERQSRQLAYAAGNVDIEFTDVARFHATAPDGKTILSLSDNISLGPIATNQVYELFWRYGLRQMPQSWGELVGNWNYCRLLNMWLMSLSSEEPVGVVDGLLAHHEARYPGRSALLRLLIVQDRDGAYAWHLADNTFVRNATDPLLTDEPQ